MKLPLSLRARLLWCKFRIRLAVECPQERDDLLRRFKRRIFRILIRDGVKTAHEFAENEFRDYHQATIVLVDKWWTKFLELVKWGLRLIGLA